MIIKVNLKPGYEIEIESGVIINKGLPEGFIITDSNIYKKYKDLIKGDFFVVKAGEKNKSVKSYLKIMEKLAESDANKIIAFGGGVIGDLAGFVASTYKRGIPLIQVPTSLLAMIDASIGGKNGVNLSEKKNYAGTIYQPEKVLIDTLFLKSLPKKEFRNGLAEMIKYAVVFNKPELNRFEFKVNSKDEDFEKLIIESCGLKVGVVEKDVDDKDYRHVLNFGHTVGHAIELLAGLSHGEAISIGMIKELELGIQEGLIAKEKLEKVRKCLEKNNLPVEFPTNIDKEKVIGLMKKDKKGSLVFAFDEKNYNVKIDEEKIRKFLGI